MIKLSVNINKIATLRNARGNNIPNVVEAAKNIEKFGADGITIHPRPDERHIKYADVYDLKKVVSTEFNIEGFPNKKFIDLVLEVQPTQVTLVPDPPDAITSNAGWNAKQHLSFLKEVIQSFKNAGIRTSIFMETDIEQIDFALKTGADRIELYTEPFAANFNNKSEAIVPFVNAAQHANNIGLGVNAGHDLNLQNLHFFAQSIPFLKEVSIGHALIADSLYFGLENTVNMYKSKLIIE